MYFIILVAVIVAGFLLWDKIYALFNPMPTEEEMEKDLEKRVQQELKNNKKK